MSDELASEAGDIAGLGNWFHRRDAILALVQREVATERVRMLDLPDDPSLSIERMLKKLDSDDFQTLNMLLKMRRAEEPRDG